MTDLSPAQLQFLTKYLDFDQAGWFRKLKLKDQIQEFWRRRDKAEAEIRDLPPGHPSKAGLEKAVQDATRKAEGGDIRGAYENLESTKKQAREVAKVVRDGVDLNTVQGNVAELRKAVQAGVRLYRDTRDFAEDKTQTAIDKATALADITGKTHDEVMAGVSANYRAEAEILTEWAGVAVTFATKYEALKGALTAQPSITGLIALTAHNINLLNKKDPTAATMPHVSDFTSAEELARNHGLDGDPWKQLKFLNSFMKQRHESLLTTLRAKKAHLPLETFAMTDYEGNPITGAEAAKKKDEMARRFAIVEAQEKERFEKAEEAYRDAVTNDAVLSSTVDTSPMTNRNLRKIDVADELWQAGIDVTDTSQTPDAIAQAAGQLVSNKYDAAMQNAGPLIPDEVFHMCSRSNRDWYIEAASAAGITFDPDQPETIDPKVWARIKAAGDRMAETVRQKYPNTSKFGDNGPEEIVLGGVKYTDFKKLGEGGGGTVYLGKDASGNKVVLKTPKGYDPDWPLDELTFKEFAGEAENHRAASGGESDPCPGNILDMKGMVLAPNGLPLIAMDLAENGDANDYTYSMSAAESTGLVSPQAKAAMDKMAVQDMLKGLKAMQTSGMVHNDLKQLNVFVDKDGTFKVADFGLSRHVDTHDSPVGEDKSKVGQTKEHTPGYQPPELEGEGAMTQKSDNFTMGVILSKMTDPYHGKSSIVVEGGAGGKTTEGKRLDAQGKATSAGALDRLVNGLLDPDPTKRPTVDAALQSSFLADPGENYTKEDVERLRKATAEYSAKLGKEVVELSNNMLVAEGKIVKLEESKSDTGILREIEKLERAVKERDSEARETTRLLQIEFDPEKRKLLETDLKFFQNAADLNRKKIVNLRKTLGNTKTEVELKEIEQKIEQERQKVIKLRTQIDAIHKKPEHKDVIEELEAANEAFMKKTDHKAMMDKIEAENDQFVKDNAARMKRTGS